MSSHARAFDLPGWPCPPRVRDISRLDEPDRWIPVATVLPDLPDFVTTPGVPA